MNSLSKPNKATVIDMIEAERIVHDASAKGYKNVEDALAELKR